MNTIGHEYDLDSTYGCQCWDYASLFWRNVGFPVGYPLTGPLQYAYQCWTVSRVQNSSYNGTTYFDLIDVVTNIQKGDIIVMDGRIKELIVIPSDIDFIPARFRAAAMFFPISITVSPPSA